jgi:MFS family permease
MSIDESHKSCQTIDLTRLRWRFVICVASFYVNIVAWGFISSTGIFEDAFKTAYRLSSLKSALPGSIQIGTMSICSIFASVLTIKFGVRCTTVAGAFIATSGSILAAIVGNYWAFCLFHGLFIGAGEALMLVPASCGAKNTVRARHLQAVLAIPPYFHASRVSMATASAVSGASVGMFGVPFLLKYLLDAYGLRAATLLASCLWLSVALAGCLFGQGVSSMDDNSLVEVSSDEYRMNKTEAVPEPPVRVQYKPTTSAPAVIFSRRVSILPTPTQHCLLQPYRSDRPEDSQPVQGGVGSMLDIPTLDKRQPSWHVQTKSDRLANTLVMNRVQRKR